MPLDTVSSIIVRGALQDVSIAYRNGDYVSDMAFPIIDGLSRKTKVAKYAKGQWFRDLAEVRAPGTAARVADMKVSSVNLDPIQYATATQVTDEELEESKKTGNIPIQPEIDAQEFMADILDLSREARTAAVVHAASWSGEAAGGVDAEGGWGHATAASDTFLADIKTATDTIKANTGKLPNTLLLSYPAWSALKIAPALLALMYPTSLAAGSLVQVSSLEALIGMKVIVGGAITNSLGENAADDAFAPVYTWGTSGSDRKGIGFVYYRPERPGLKVVSAGYQYRVKQAGGSGRLLTSWRDDARHATMYDAIEEVDIAAVCLDAGFLFKDTATT